MLSARERDAIRKATDLIMAELANAFQSKDLIERVASARASELLQQRASVAAKLQSINAAAAKAKMQTSPSSARQPTNNAARDIRDASASRVSESPAPSEIKVEASAAESISNASPQTKSLQSLPSFVKRRTQTRTASPGTDHQQDRAHSRSKRDHGQPSRRSLPSTRDDTESVVSDRFRDDESMSETSSVRARPQSPDKLAPTRSPSVKAESTPTLPGEDDRDLANLFDDVADRVEPVLDAAPAPSPSKKKGKRKEEKRRRQRNIEFTSSEDEAPKSTAQAVVEESIEDVPAVPEPETVAVELEAVPIPTPDDIVLDDAEPELPLSVAETREYIDDGRQRHPFDAAVADDDEDLYYIKLAIQRKRDGKPLHPDPSEDASRPEEVHQTGAARTEGYYKIAAAHKSSYLPLRNRAQVDVSGTDSSISVSRNARATTRRLQQGIADSKKSSASDTEVLKFNQLRARKKQLKFSRSPIRKLIYPFAEDQC